MSPPQLTADAPVFDNPVADADADRLTRRRQYAVGNGDLLARARIFERLGIRAQSYAVVTGIDLTVADRHEAAAVEVDAVAVGGHPVVVDSHAADIDVFTSVEETAPIRRLAKFDIGDGNAGRLAKEEHLPRTPCGTQELAGAHLVLRAAEKGFAAAVDDRLLAILFCSMLLWGHITDKPFRIEWFVYCQTAAYLLAIAVALGIVLGKSKLRRLAWNKKLSLLILKKSLPFALLTLLMAFYNRIDSVMIERLLPVDIATTQAGIYASAFRLLDALVMIAYLFSVILLPLFSKMIKEKEDVQPIVRTAFSFLYVFAIGATTVLVCYREPILAWLYNDHVAASASVFAILTPCIIPIAFTYVFGTLLTANGSLKKLNITAMAGIIVNILINIILIPRVQARGAAVTSLCTQSVVSLLQFFIAIRELKVPLRSLPWLSCLIFTVELLEIEKDASKK